MPKERDSAIHQDDMSHLTLDNATFTADQLARRIEKQREKPLATPEDIYNRFVFWRDQLLHIHTMAEDVVDAAEKQIIIEEYLAWLKSQSLAARNIFLQVWEQRLLPGRYDGLHFTQFAIRHAIEELYDLVWNNGDELATDDDISFANTRIYAAIDQLQAMVRTPVNSEITLSVDTVEVITD